MTNFPAGTRVRIVNYQDGIDGITGTIVPAEDRHAEAGLFKVVVADPWTDGWLHDGQRFYGLFLATELERIE